MHKHLLINYETRHKPILSHSTCVCANVLLRFLLLLLLLLLADDSTISNTMLCRCCECIGLFGCCCRRCRLSPCCCSIIYVCISIFILWENLLRARAMNWKEKWRMWTRTRDAAHKHTLNTFSSIHIIHVHRMYTAAESKMCTYISIKKRFHSISKRFRLYCFDDMCGVLLDLCVCILSFSRQRRRRLFFFLKTRKIRCSLFTQTTITFEAVVGCFFQSHWKQWKSNMKQPLPAHKFHKHIDTINNSSFLRQTENTVWFAPKQISTYR